MQDVGVEVQESANVPSVVPSAASSVRSESSVFDDSGFVDFVVTGTHASGEFRCTDCGYGAVVQRALPQCPMCAGTVWESRGPSGPRFAG